MVMITSSTVLSGVFFESVGIFIMTHWAVEVTGAKGQQRIPVNRLRCHPVAFTPNLVEWPGGFHWQKC